ncbi:MAG: hypothetical protein NZ809_05165 [Thermodesulfovibrio sp.]|nr:hypothetical protein [Thermodesulfovibrio sp.]
MKTLLKIAVITMGFSSIVAQMVLLRELLIVFAGNELSIGIIIANWLILEAFGCFLSSKRVELSKNRVELFAAITIFFSLSLPVAIYLTRVLKVILGVSIGESLGFFTMFYSSFFILLPVSVAHGALFPFICKIYSLLSDEETSAGKVYAYETVGIIFGGIIWTYLLIPYFHSFQIVIGLAFINLLVILIILLYYRTVLLTKVIVAVSVLAIIGCGYLLFTDEADKIHTLSIKNQWRAHRVAHYQNSLYGNICIIEREGQYIFFVDGILNLITPIPDIAYVEEFVHLPLLIHPEPKKVLVISGGAGGVIDAILKHPSIQEVEYTELDPLIIKLIRKFSTPLTKKELDDKRVKVEHIDGHLFMKATKNKYDLIFIGLSNPSDLQINRFFTKEFFTLAKKRLNESGIVVIGLTGSLSYINDELRNLNACIFNTLKSVFPYVRVFPGDDINLFVSSLSEDIFLIDTQEIIERLKQRKLSVEILLPWYIEKKLHQGWQNWLSTFFENTTQRINTDFAPIGLFYSISYWNTLFAPYLVGIFKLLERVTFWHFFILFLIFSITFLLLKGKKRDLFGSGIPLCIATTGFAGMLFDISVIFVFQLIYGYVFSWIGLIVTFFMAGATAGALTMTYCLKRIKHSIKFFLKTDLSVILFSALLPLIFVVLYSYSEKVEFFSILKVSFLIISFVGGFLTGLQFPLATKIELESKKNLSKSAGLLYSLDLLGGWFGGIVGSVILLPILGVIGSFKVVVLLKLWSFLILIINSRLLRKADVIL